MIDLSRLEWLMGQVAPVEVAARLRLKALERLCQPGEPKMPASLPSAAAFAALSRRDEILRAAGDTGVTANMVAEADAVLAGDFTLFAAFPHRIESGIPDWYAAFPSGPPWPAAYSFDIDISGRDGRDVRFTWELSRHRHLASLAQAWFVTGDSKYSGRLEALLADWIAKNPFLVGPNWTSALEAAVRAIAWTFVDDAAGAAFLYTGFHDRFVRALYAHGLYVETFLGAGLNPSNHIIGEAAGLFILGTKFRRTDAGRRWRARATRILEGETFRQTFPSGASREQAIAYHRFVTDLFSLCAVVGGRDTFSERFFSRLELMRGFAASVTRPDGSLPASGDSDDASVMPALLSCVTAPDFASCRVPSVALSTGSLPSPPGRALSTDGIPSPPGRALSTDGIPSPPGRGVRGEGGNPPASVLYPDTGLAVLKSEDASCQLEFRCGPQGYSPVSSHGHADALAVTLWHGRDRLVDAGTYRYNGDDAWRNAFRSTHFHNTVVVDGMSQAVPASRFRWRTLADARPAGHYFSPEVDWISGELPPGPSRCWSHFRDVIRLGSRVVLILDTVEARGEHTATAYFHFGDAGLSVDALRADARYSDGWTMSLRAMNTAATVAALTYTSPVPAWRSRSYGVIEPSATLAASAPFAGRIVLPWILSLGGDCVTGLPPATNGAFAADLSVGAERYLFIMPLSADVTQVEDLSYIGRWALLQFRAGTFVKAFCAGPRALGYKGKRLFSRLGGVDFSVITL